MFTDSCSCYRRAGHGCKGHSRMSRCPVCDKHKIRKRCQSEGLYQEGDPLKELNWCCDRGCDLLNRSSKCCQKKKTDSQKTDKKMNGSGEADADKECNKKYHSKMHKGKCDNEINNDDVHSDVEIKHLKSHKIPDETKRPFTAPYENLKCYPMNAIVTSNSKLDKNSSEMRARYIKEMEILKFKLNLLKDDSVGDGKRLRQKSESEPGFPELPGCVPKRARDLSPKRKMGGRKLPSTPTGNQTINRFPFKHNTHFQRESKSLSPTLLKNSEKGGTHRPPFSKTFKSKTPIKDLIVNESDEDHGDGAHDKDIQNKYETEVISSYEDENSVLSTSSDSNTPSKVGETLGMITLDEMPKKKEAQSIGNQNIDTKSVPQIEPSPQKSLISRKDLFRSSLFPNVPPYVKFFTHDFKGPTLPLEITKHLKWKLSSITPIVIRRTLLNSGFKLVRSSAEQFNHLTFVSPFKFENNNSLLSRDSRTSKKYLKESNEWTGQWGKHMKSFVFKTLKDFQKLNHFPGTFQIGRKDRLWKNLYRLMVKFGKKEFGFTPKTYILPHDRKSLRTAWEKSTGPGKGQWILKPPAAARGTGIKVIHKWGQIPKKKSIIVQKYIAQPYLINGSKFDLRLYVLMTSIHPLRIYLYDDGLVRFASVKYSNDVECLSNRFMHLTNYSINKLSNQYQVNADASSCNGHKWSLKSLWTYLSKEGINVKVLKRNLVDLVIKTIISGESNINILSKNNLPSRYCSYELFGIDVLLDHSLKPWLLEVNISPSLHSASPLDLAVKGPLVKELLNIAGFQIPAKLTKEQEEGFLESYGIKDKTHTLCYDKRLYWTILSKEEKAKQDSFRNTTRKEYLSTILKDLTPDDIRHLIQFEDELTQIHRFEKIFPTTHTYTYHQYFESPRYYNMMLDAWETKYQKNRKEGIQLLVSLCEQKLHLNVAATGGSASFCQSLNDLTLTLAPPKAEEESDIDAEKEPQTDVEEEVKESETLSPQLKMEELKNSSKPKSPPKLGVVSKPTVFSPHTINRRPKTAIPVKCTSAEDQTNDQNTSLKESCFKMFAEIRSNGLKLPGDSMSDKLKPLPNCKLENSIINESLTHGKNALSTGKHIRSACIKMNTTS